MFDSERNKPHRRVSCNEIRRVPYETIKKFAKRTEILVQKFYTLFTHVYENTKMTENIRVKTEKHESNSPSSIPELDTDLCKLVEQLEQAEFTMK